MSTQLGFNPRGHIDQNLVFHILLVVIFIDRVILIQFFQLFSELLFELLDIYILGLFQSIAVNIENVCQFWPTVSFTVIDDYPHDNVFEQVSPLVLLQQDFILQRLGDISLVRIDLDIVHRVLNLSLQIPIMRNQDPCSEFLDSQLLLLFRHINDLVALHLPVLAHELLQLLEAQREHLDLGIRRHAHLHLIVEKNGPMIYDRALPKQIDYELIFLEFSLNLDYTLLNYHERLDIALTC